MLPRLDARTQPAAPERTSKKWEKKSKRKPGNSLPVPLASLMLIETKGQVNYGDGAAKGVGQLAGAELGSRMVIQRAAHLVRPMLMAVVIILASKLIWDGYFR